MADLFRTLREDYRDDAAGYGPPPLAVGERMDVEFCEG